MEKSLKDTNQVCEQIVNELLQMYNAASTKEYFGEPVSQLEHALQCAKFAFDATKDEEITIAALLHDIGHLLPNLVVVQQVFKIYKSFQQQMGSVGVLNHEIHGANFLSKLGFSEKVVSLVKGHVDAKRYLVAKNEKYTNKLSAASTETLKYQGGPMSADEMESFEKDPLFELKVKLRTWDEKSKLVGYQVPVLATYKDMLLRHLTENKKNEM